jgi:hypothetical protein
MTAWPWSALKDGTIDIIVSAHDPQDVDTKRLPFADAENGAIGLETLLAAALRLYHSGDVTLMRLMDAMSTRPAKMLGLMPERLSRRACRYRAARSRVSVGARPRTTSSPSRRTPPSRMPVQRQSIANTGCRQPQFIAPECDLRALQHASKGGRTRRGYDPHGPVRSHDARFALSSAICAARYPSV